MGTYLNRGNKGFQRSINSKIYVDKTALIELTNEALDTEQNCICVSRPRRFGKSMAAKMLNAYYSCGCNSAELFKNLAAAKISSFRDHLNKHDVIFLNMQEFLSGSDNIKEMLQAIDECVIEELSAVYNNLIRPDEKSLIKALNAVYNSSEKGFIFIIDEWDCIFREKSKDTEAQNKYLDYLRNLLKDRDYVNLAYMTGILPIKKYGSHSALNMFREVSMTRPAEFSKLMGFTETEVKALCAEFNMDFSEARRWYDGYVLSDTEHIYNPKSVVDSMLQNKYQSYWTMTETYEALKAYIDMDYDGLRTSIIEMIGGGRIKINPDTFSNDMNTFSKKDDVLTLLIHLGYLAFDSAAKEVFIPNEEIRGEFITATDNKNWTEVINAVQKSEQLLENVFAGNNSAIA